MPQSIKEYINELMSEKFRSFIIHSKNEMQNSNFVKETATKLGGKYIDLLNLFETEPSLHSTLDYFNSTKFVELIKKESKGEKLIFVDKFSFLWDTWNEKDKQDFLLMIEKQWNSYYKEMQATLIFTLPYDYTLINKTIKDTRGRSRIKDINEFSAII